MNFENLFKIIKTKEEKKLELKKEEKGDGLPLRFPNKGAQEEIAKKVNIQKIIDECEIGQLFGGERIINSISRLVLELRDRIPQYDTILSDDASGRLISLILKQLIDKKRKEEEKPNSKIYFLASGQHRDEKINSLIQDFILKRKNELGNTLLVTEFIATGGSISPLVEVLEREGINFDLATISVSRDPSENYGKQIQRHLYYGEVGNSALNLHNVHQYSGIEKNKEIMTPYPVALNKNDRDQRSVHNARQDVKMIAEELSKLLE